MNRYFSNFAHFALMLLAISAVPAFAQEEGTLKFHASAPVAIPGQVLPAGDYKLSIVESAVGARQVKVLDANGKFLRLIPIYRTFRFTATDDSVVNMVANGSGLLRINTFYFGAASDGFQFIYGKSDLQKMDASAQLMRKGSAINGQ
jgi:hypothetical protein